MMHIEACEFNTCLPLDVGGEGLGCFGRCCREPKFCHSDLIAVFTVIPLKGFRAFPLFIYIPPRGGSVVRPASSACIRTRRKLRYSRLGIKHA
jgi:hypothetical protein